MSSAALQAAPHQSSTITSLSPATSPSNRQYAAQPIQPREPYFNQQSSNASPPSTTATARRPARRPSGNGASANTAQQQYIYSPIGSAPTSAPVTSRPSNSPAQASPTTTNNTSGYPTTAPIEYQRGVPPVAPPRTSSNQRTSGAVLTAASASDRSRRSAHTAEPNSGRMAATGDSQQDRTEFDRTHSGVRQINGSEMGKDDTAASATATSRSRRRTQQATPETYPQRSNSNREPRSTQSPSAAQSQSQAMANASAPSPNGLSREGSEILNRVIVSKPEVDLERERERMAEAQPSSITTDGKVITGLSVVGSEGLDDTTRGSRSRHDHTASSSKREKHTRFGEYYLGNTLGEGEFGKVKMGWKQEGGVQVSGMGIASSNILLTQKSGCHQAYPSRQRRFKSHSAC
jgi:protein-serine/threonine kinase